ncbi:hypothetical protein [Timonella senegalensis]|uniref:hypothetical protein n=1 Tax=Timonella senegalensis TaxID=1465825 RepID=UPI0028A6E00A|nr:hypothetical protein [Timonella senegalensis]
MDQTQQASPATLVFQRLFETRNRAISFRDLSLAFIQLEDRVELLRAQGSPTKTYRSALKFLAGFIVDYERGKRPSPSNADPIGTRDWMGLEDALATLEILDHQLSVLQAPVTPETVADVRDFILELKEALLKDDSIGRDHKNYLAMLMRHVESCLDENSIYGEFDLRAAVERLVGVLNSVIPTQKRESPAWSKVFKKLSEALLLGLLAGAGEHLYLQIDTAVDAYLKAPVGQIEAPSSSRLQLDLPRA